MNAAWVTALIALMTALGTLTVWGVRLFWRATYRLFRFLDDYNGHPADGDAVARPGVQQRLGRLEALVQQVVAETKPNGGTSLRDVVHQTAADVMKLRTDVTTLKRRVEKISEEHE